MAKQTANPETYEAYEQARNNITENSNNNFKLTKELKKSSKALAKEIRNNISAETTEAMNKAITDSLQDNEVSENQIESVIKYASNQTLSEADVTNIQNIDSEVLDTALKSGVDAAELDYSQKIVKATKASDSKKAIDTSSYNTDSVDEADGIYYNGNKSDIISFSNAKNGEVKLSNGDTVNVSDLEMSSKQATLVEGIRQIADKYSIGNDDATILYEMATGTLDSDTDTYNLMYAVDDAIRLGSLGVKSAEKVLSSSAFITAVSQNAIAKNVIDKAYNIAYNASETVKLHDSQISNAIKGKGKLNYDKSVTEKGLKNYSREQRAHIAVAESLSKVFSNKITVYDSENVSGDMQWAKTKNGSFRSQDGTIWVDINAQQGVLGALSHELTHMVSLLDESTFKKISEILIDEYADITKTKSVEDYIREYEERLNLGTKAAYEEFVADCMTNMLTDTNAAETIVKLRNTMNEKAQNKFIKLINDTIRTLKSFVKRSNAIEAASITSQLKSLQKISDLWAQGVSNAMLEFEKTENKSVNSTEAYDVKSSSKIRYDEFRTNAMIWANSANTQVGDTKIFNNKGKGFVLVEATENGYVEVGNGSYEYVMEVKENYGTYRAGEILDRYDESLEHQRRRYDWDISNSENNSTEGRTVGLDSNKSYSNRTGNNEQSRGNSQKFSLKTNVEETKDLIAVHNLTEAKLLKSLELGGLPMPSIAIVKAKSSHSSYGDISLVFNKSTIDPKASRYNKVYGGDAWTPTYPAIEYKANEKVADKIHKLYYDLAKKYGYDEARPLYNLAQDLEGELSRRNGEAGLIEYYKDDTSLMNLYLTESGKNKVQPIVNEIRTEMPSGVVEQSKYLINGLGEDVVNELKDDNGESPIARRRKYFDKYGEKIKEAYAKYIADSLDISYEEAVDTLSETKTGEYLRAVDSAYKYLHGETVTVKAEIDRAATDNAIKKAAGDGYTKWLKDLLKGAEEKSGIRNNVDYFTPMGNRRSFEALHWENNLENVVKAMREEAATGNASIFSGLGIWGVSAKNYSSIEDIKSDKNRLSQMSEEEYSKLKTDFGERLHDIAVRIMDKTERNQFIAVDNAEEAIVDAVRSSKSKSAILKNLKQYIQLNVTEADVDDIVELVGEISNMPTEYFEAKPQRAVGFNEVATAIIPNNSSEELKTALDEKGVAYREYEAGNEEARTQVLNSLEDVKFSEKLTNIVDSDGKKLSEAQAEFFKGSKVRDEDGNLLKVYHGTNSDFTVFNRGEKNGQFGKGIYFAADKSYAKENGKKVVSAYLNVENPFTVTDNTNILTAINEKFPGTDYFEMTKVLADNGYDGIIYDHWENGKIIVAFEPNQIKLTDNLTPTENEDVRFSDKLDTDYLKLASEPENNEKELNMLVESAAMEWGAYSTDGKKPVRLYHGTDEFGFTKFDISKSDDRRTIFLTSSPEIASTYSQVSGERKISDRTDIDVDKLSMAKTVELLNKYPEYSDFEYEYSYTNCNETEKKLNAELNKLNALVDKLMEKYGGDDRYDSVDTADYYDRLKRIKKLIFDKEQRDKYLSTQLYINLNNTDMFSGNEDFINEVEQNVRLANILEAKGNPKANYVVEKSMGGYSIELLSFDEAKDKLRDSQKHGNYALYAKFDNPLVIDADGKNWNDIYAILEPSEKTTFKAEYDSKSNTLVLSDEKGEFSKLAVDGTLESVLPSMARAITNRYGKFFAATVLNQAKDKLKNSSVAEVPVRTTGKRNTREIAEFAQEQGYDGVIFKNLRDNGGRNAMVKMKTTADIFVTFTPETIKSADTVTYGDDGKVIPLSKRFSADEDIRYSEKNSLNSEEKGIKQQMIDASAELDKMEPVVSFNEMPTFNSKQDVVEWALKKFEKFGDYITRKGYGDIVFDRKRITKGLSYLKTYEERVALATVPYVLEKGEPIFSKGNHKARGYSTITFSAPVIINGNRANVGVVVREEENNYYKTHRVILPDGSQLVFENDIKKGSNTETKGMDGNPHLSSTDITSTNSLSQIPENVNSKFSEKIGKAEYEKVIKSLERDNAALREDVNDLKELVKVQGKVTHGEVFTKTSVEAVAKKLARDFGMRGEKTELVKMLNEYYSSIASSASDSNLNFTGVMENALPIAQYIKRR